MANGHTIILLFAIFSYACANLVNPWKYDMNLAFDWGSGGAYIATGFMNSTSWNVDTGAKGTGYAPLVTITIDPAQQMFIFNDNQGDFYYTPNGIFAVYPALGPQCYNVTGNYATVNAAYDQVRNTMTVIDSLGGLDVEFFRVYEGLIADPSICKIRNSARMSQDSKGRVRKWMVSQEFGFEEGGFVIERLIVTANYVFPDVVSYPNGLSASNFTIPASCATPLNDATYCNTLYFGHWKRRFGL